MDLLLPRSYLVFHIRNSTVLSPIDHAPDRTVTRLGFNSIVLVLSWESEAHKQNAIYLANVESTF